MNLSKDLDRGVLKSDAADESCAENWKQGVLQMFQITEMNLVLSGHQSISMQSEKKQPLTEIKVSERITVSPGEEV